MLDNILNLVKQEVLGTVTNNPEIPADKKDDVVQTTTSTIMNSLKDQMTHGNLSSITSLFGGSGVNNSTPPATHPLVNTLQSSVASALNQKVGLNMNVATSIAAAVIPTIIGLFSKKVNDSNEPGFNVQSLIESFTGSNSNSITSMLGKLFGK